MTRNADTDGACALVVDDDPDVRSVLGSMLRAFGYEPLLAPDGASAVAQCRTHRRTLRLVLVDWVMPDTGGEALCGSLLEAAGPVPLLVCSSADLGDTTVARLERVGVAGFLRKPVRMQSLAKVLDGLVWRGEAGEKR